MWNEIDATLGAKVNVNPKLISLAIREITCRVMAALTRVASTFDNFLFAHFTTNEQ